MNIGAFVTSYETYTPIDSARIEKLTKRAGPLFTVFQSELLAFADFLEANEVEEEGNNETHYSVNCKPTEEASES